MSLTTDVTFDFLPLLPVLATMGEGHMVVLKESFLPELSADEPVEVLLVERAVLESGDLRYTFVLSWMGIRLGQSAVIQKKEVQS